jgi:hypothetical protein
MTKIQNKIAFVIWNLELIWDLEFGNWSFAYLMTSNQEKKGMISRHRFIKGEENVLEVGRRA